MQTVEIGDKIWKFKDKFLIEDGYKANIKNPLSILSFMIKNLDNMKQQDWIIEHLYDLIDMLTPLLECIKVNGPSVTEIQPMDFIEFIHVGIECLIPSNVKSKNV